VTTAAEAPQRFDLVLPTLYPMQRAALYDPARYVVIEASTKSGKTVGALHWIVAQSASEQTARDWWWIAPTYRQAGIAMRRLTRGVRADHIITNLSERTVTWRHNGARIVFVSAEDPENMYGEEVHGSVVDEFTRCRPETWPALRSTLTFSRGPVRFIGNVRGRKNWGYQLARKAESGEPDFAYHRITAHDAVAAGVLEAEEIEGAQRDLAAFPGMFEQLYLAEAADDEGNPFGIEAINAAVGPCSSDPPTAWGWDLAKSVDWTVGVGLDAGGTMCRYERFQRPWDQTTTAIASLVGKTPATIDSTGVGDPIVEALQRKLGRNVEGEHFTQSGKQKLMEGLAVAIHERAITLRDDPVLLNELRSFEYEYARNGVKYSAPSGMHDDVVMALALAVKRWSKPIKTWTVD